MKRILARFLADQSGAVTVDWVVLTAAIVGLNVAIVINLVNDGMDVQMNYVDQKLDEAKDF